jgi:hypothetical protein
MCFQPENQDVTGRNQASRRAATIARPTPDQSALFYDRSVLSVPPDSGCQLAEIYSAGSGQGASKVFRDCSTQTYFQAAWALLFFIMFFKHVVVVRRLKKRMSDLESRSLQFPEAHVSEAPRA